MMNSSELNPLD